ncbi:EH signature domain-containing protein [Aquirhabdus sp.]|uniref:EH signature domain-containing protein n=1 Tax=Aquirhabdus sp. TaxID=2824160 RepID=UPI00396C4F9E
MSILSLDRALKDQLLLVIESNPIVLHQPNKLNRSVDQLLRKYDISGDGRPNQDLLLEAIQKIGRLPLIDLSLKDWRNIAWGLSVQFPQRKKLILHTDGGTVLKYIDENKKDLIATGSIYFPLLYSYFALTKLEVEEAAENWLVLRGILTSTKDNVMQRARRPRDWIGTLSKYPELLREKPTLQLAKESVSSGNDSLVKELTNQLRVPSNGWFWDQFIREIVSVICDMSDPEFKQRIDSLVGLMIEHPSHKTEILAKTMNRYATSKYRGEVHETLQKISLDFWKAPQFSENRGWQNVESKTKEMVMEWFVRADLEAFFMTFTDNADKRRFNYWMRFIKQISYSQLFFGRDSIRTTHPARKKFLDENSERYAQIRGGQSTLNAFMIKIGSIYIVEFSETGNACYFYSGMPARVGRVTERGDLSNKASGYFKEALSHSGSWEGKFDNYLKKPLGISPDQTNRTY